MTLKTKSVLTAIILVLVTVNQAFSGTLENLERERAITLGAILDASLSMEQRHNKITSVKSRLIDLERMVLRDKVLGGRNTPNVRRAFENYDLTFMAHASAEHKLTYTDNWLNQIGVSTESLMASQVRQRY